MIATLIFVGLVSTLAGCALVPATRPVVSASCPVAAGPDAACRQSGQLRWLVGIDTLVGIQTTKEGGGLQYVAAAKCPAGVTADSPYSAGWRDCSNGGDWRYDGQTIWFVNASDVMGVDATTGQIVEQTSDAGRAAQVRAIINPPDQDTKPDALMLPSPQSLGLMGNSAYQDGFMKGVDGSWVYFMIDCVAGTARDIPGATISSGRPDWAQVCLRPVLYAANI